MSTGYVSTFDLNQSSSSYSSSSHAPYATVTQPGGQSQVVMPRPPKPRFLTAENNINIEDHEFVYGSFVFAGRSNSGKNVLLKQFLKHNSKMFNQIFVFCDQVNLNDDFDYIPEKRKFNVTNVEQINFIYKLQQDLALAGTINPILIIVDDFISKINLHSKEGKVYERISSSGRHAGIYMCFLTQNINKLPPVIRDNTHYWIVSLMSQSEINKLYTYAPLTHKKKAFMDYYTYWTSRPYHTMMIQLCNPYALQIYYLNPAPFDG